MKKLFKIIASVVLSAAMLAPSAAVNADPSGQASKATFVGLREGFVFEPGSSYTDNDLFAEFKDVMPGDVLTEVIEVKNDCVDYSHVSIYIRAIPHNDESNPLSPAVAEKETVATMEDFLSQLSMRVWYKNELIYEASPDEPAQFAGYYFLGNFRYLDVKTLRVELEVPLTLGNEYANRAGEVDWFFYAECFAYGEGEGGEGGGGGGGGGDVVFPETDSLTVTKVWRDGGVVRPVSITVRLLRDGKLFDTKSLTSRNQWTYTWSELDKDYDWTVREVVPAGYTATYDTYGGLVVITNTKPIPPDVPDKPVDPNKPGETDKPSGTDSYDETGKPGIPGIPDVTDKPGETDTPSDTGIPVDTDEPIDTDYQIDTGAPIDTDMPIEPEIPVVPVKPIEPDGTVSVSVAKKWAGDEESIKNRPETVIVTLFNGTKPIEQVYLGDHNEWTYTWRGLSADGEWRVIEIDIPENYTPSYSVTDNGTVIITNNASLIATGQVKWHIPLLAGMGIILVGLGLIMVFKKKKHEN